MGYLRSKLLSFIVKFHSHHHNYLFHFPWFKTLNYQYIHSFLLSNKSFLYKDQVLVIPFIDSEGNLFPLLTIKIIVLLNYYYFIVYILLFKHDKCYELKFQIIVFCFLKIWQLLEFLF